MIKIGGINIPEYLAPGVYIEEFEIGAKPIEGVSTSTAGFVGFAEMGPLNRPILVTSFAEYQSIFGGYLPEDKEYDSVRWLPYAVEGFFSNGGKRAYIVRVAVEGGENEDSNAKAASGFIPDISGITTHLTAETKAGSFVLMVDDITGLKPEDILFLRDGALSEYFQLRFANTAKTLTLNAPLTGSMYAEGTEITKLIPGPTDPADPDTYQVQEKLESGDTEIMLDDVSGLTAGDAVLLDKNENAEICILSAINDTQKSITVSQRLKLKHNQGAEIQKLSIPETDPETAVTLMELKAGDLIIPVAQEAAEFDVNSALKIGDEYFLIRAVETGNLLLSEEKLKYQHKMNVEIKQLVKAINVSASSEGKWGNRIKVMSNLSSLSEASLTEPASNKDTLTLSTVNGMEKGTLLKIEPKDKAPIYETVKEVIKAGSSKKVVLGSTVNENLDTGTRVSTVEFNLKIRFDGSEEIFKNLSMNSNHSRYITRVISEESSRLIRIEDVSSTQDPAEKIPMPTQGTEPGWLLAGGTDGIPEDEGKINETYAGKDDLIPEKRTGLHTLKNKEDISIVAVPGIATQAIQDKIIAQCEETKDRFAVLDPERGSDLDEIQGQRNLYDSKYAALYYPWVQAYDPASKKQINIPPSGHVCGIYARSDIERGVHKAPANEKINGALDLERTGSAARVITKGQQEVLNPKGINCIIPFPGRGIRVWGARTISSDSLWKYINVRRLFIYIEKSIENGTQWVVFEPNNEKLWARVDATITQFLTGVWRDGALMGTKPEEAFFIKCDRTTMTQDDIDNGKLICVIGIAPVKPAEFVIFRIAQWAGGSAATE
ncbi:phage tail sheath family protein [Methanosarcina sp.]|uniref:phage tail sheath family protein n=1 Tax=Methanosarcina sp. TaxID=2213 RepID=UPI002AB8F9FE|nr:phage tail sheath subtilisin-like domain-containing protein [Methanosarcina sp.]MDY9927103.1 phage tail sheath subtilisin-like domain-containing protein [Methanosarcina sp.]